MKGLTRYPRSFQRLLLVGFLLTALPAVLGLLAVMVAMDKLASQGQAAILQAVSATQTSRELAEAVRALERSARQYAILRDAELLAGYDARREALTESIASLRRLGMDEEGSARIADIERTEQSLHDALHDEGLDAVELGAQFEGFVRMDEWARLLRQRAEQRIDRESAALREAAEEGRSRVLWQLAMLLPVLVFLVIGFSVLIARPIKDLDAAIRRLGQGRLKEAVAVGGTDDLRDLGQRLEWMRQQLLGLEAEKNRFMREVSHALKTPLAALREGVSLLDEGSLGPMSAEQREVTAILQRQSLELQRLVQGLLRYEASRFPGQTVDLIPIALDTLVDTVLQAHVLTARNRGIRLERRIDLPRLMLDETKMRDMLDNLLSNAIKYSPDGETVSLLADWHHGQLDIDVRDRGPGVPSDERERIFDPFVQGRMLPGGRMEGSGVGLSIVRELARALGGDIQLLDSAPGAHFRLSLPAGVAP